ncbi:MAG: hypothetical protein K2N88_04605, partial [Muribaculaceae bacterium]|nr:hypothetical protein [Muribaculaceae bacterium]
MTTPKAKPKGWWESGSEAQENIEILLRDKQRKLFRRVQGQHLAISEIESPVNPNTWKIRPNRHFEKRYIG